MRFSGSLAALAAFVLTLASARPAQAQAGPLSVEERERLVAGSAILRPATQMIGDRRYVGGIGYAVIPCLPEQLAAILADAAAMQEILPRTQAILPITRLEKDALFELHQGNSLVHASYTLRVRQEPERNRMRFWLDRSRPHAIDDAWGFFRYEPFESPSGPALLVTYGVLVDLGSGVFRSLYENRIIAMALTVPQRLREYVTSMRSSAKPA
jgi:hypothetical protein